jgi:hypothetical protein
MKTSAIVLAIAALSTGCASANRFTPSPRMADASPGAIAPSVDTATVVFVRPSGYVGIWNPTLLLDGKPVADLEAQRRVVLRVPPGDHVFVAGMADSPEKFCRQLVAKVEAGKLYFVESTIANGADLFAVRPSDAPRLREWLVRAPSTRQLDAAGASANPVDPGWQTECMKAAAEHLADEDAEDRARHVLGPADAFAAVP